MDPTSSLLLPRSTAIGLLNEEDTMSSKHLWWGPFTSTFCEHCFEHHLWSEYSCTTLIENFYVNVLKKKLVFEDCYMTQLTFFETGVTLPVKIYRIVTKNFYCTFKLSSLDCSHCNLCRTCDLFIPTRSII